MFDRTLGLGALKGREVVPPDRAGETALQGGQLPLELKSLERLKGVGINLGKALSEELCSLTQIAVLLVALFADPAADLFFFCFRELGNREDVGVATALDDVFRYPLELFEELLAVGDDHGPRRQRDRAEPSKVPPG